MEKWYVLHCNDEDSHVLLREDALIFDSDTLAEGDEVKFFYPGIKSMLVGTIKGISDNYKAMVKLLDKLNVQTKPKREKSFHADQLRAAAQRCKEKGFKVGRSGLIANANGNSNANVKGQHTQSSSRTSRNKQPESAKQTNNNIKQEIVTEKTKGKDNGKSILGQVLEVSSSEDSDCSSTSLPERVERAKSKEDHVGADQDVDKVFSPTDENSDSELTKEELALLKKLTEKNKSRDIKALLSLSQSGSRIGASSVTKQDVLSKTVKDLSSSGGKSSVTCNTSGETVHDLQSSGGNSSRTCNTSVENTEVSSVNLSPDSFLSTEDKPENFTSQTDDNTAEVKLHGGIGYKSIKALKAAKRRRLSRENGDEEGFKGEYFNYHPQSEVSTVELVPNSNVWVSASGLKKLKKLRTPTALARACLREVFTKEARLACSVSGKAFTNSDKKNHQTPCLEPRRH